MWGGTAVFKFMQMHVSDFTKCGGDMLKYNWHTWGGVFKIGIKS